MVTIEFIEGSDTFKINNITLVRNFHSYVSGTKLRIVNAYDTLNELLPYTLFSEVSVNGQSYGSAVLLAEVLAPILFSKQGGSGGTVIGSSNIITKSVQVPMDWNLNPEDQIVDFINSQAFSVLGTQRILFKAVRIIGDVSLSNSAEIYFWEFKPGKGNYGVGGTNIATTDLEYISFITNAQNNVFDIGEIGGTPIEVFVNSNGPYSINLSKLNIFKALRNGTPVNYIYIGNATEIGEGVSQTINDEFIDVNATPVQSPTYGGPGTAVERTIKPLANTTQYTLVAADFTDFILDFTANLGESIQVILNAGVAPLNGQIQAISSGNNFLIPTAGAGVTMIPPVGTNLKTTATGWFGGVVLSTDKISINGNLESTDPAGQTYSVFNATTDGLVPTPNEVGTTKYLRQDGTWVVPTDTDTNTTYSVFTNTVEGLVPAPNVSSTSTFSIALTTPTEGQTFTEGDPISLTSTITETVASPNLKVLKSTGWQEDGEFIRPFKEVNAATYTLVAEDINFYLLFRSTECVVTIPENVFSDADELKGFCYSAPSVEFTSVSQIVNDQGSISKINTGGYFSIKYKANLSAFLLTGDLVAGREEKYIDGSVTPIYTLQAEDKYKFLSLRLQDLTMHIPAGVFQNGDVIKGFCHTANATFTSDMNVTPRPSGSTSKCIGYFEIKISSTGSTQGTQNALAAILTGDFYNDRLLLKSSDGNTIWEIEVNELGNLTATDKGLNF